jgi:hypothetical protein
MVQSKHVAHSDRLADCTFGNVFCAKPEWPTMGRKINNEACTLNQETRTYKVVILFSNCSNLSENTQHWQVDMQV